MNNAEIKLESEMKTIKQVSDLTGISVRMLHYYDKIGLLKPTGFTGAGYRLYDDEALETLQQILFFKELDISLKAVKEIMTSPDFDKKKALKNQKKLLILERKRLNDLIALIDKAVKGENTMSFKEFDMTEYYRVLEEFKTENKNKVIREWGSVDKFDEFIEKVKTKETEIAKDAIKQYGSIKKYTEALKNNLNNDILTMKSEQINAFKKDILNDQHPELKELYQKLVSDLNKDPSSEEIRGIAEAITNTAKNDYEVFRTDMGNDYWHGFVQIYSVYPAWIEEIDQKYGSGASEFIGRAFKNYMGDHQPQIELLYRKLTSDLNKRSDSIEVQEIVEEIAALTKHTHELLKVDVGDNYWGYMAEFYLSKPGFITAIDEKYGSGASEFIGEALKYYNEKNR